MNTEQSLPPSTKKEARILARAFVDAYHLKRHGTVCGVRRRNQCAAEILRLLDVFREQGIEAVLADFEARYGYPVPVAPSSVPVAA